MALDLRVVEAIFTRLLVAYAGRWLNYVEGIPAPALKAEWATVLDGVPRWRIDRAMEVLDDSPNPPTPRMFKAWCFAVPDSLNPEQKRLDGPKQVKTPEGTAAGRAMIADAMKRYAAIQASRKPDQWIDELRRKPNLTLAVSDMLERGKLNRTGGSGEGIKWITPIERAALPPAMREFVDHRDRTAPPTAQMDQAPSKRRAKR